MGKPKDIHVKTDPDVVILDGEPTTNSDPEPYPIYKEKEALTAYSCFVWHGKLI